MCCKGWGKQVRWCRHNGHFKKHPDQHAAKLGRARRTGNKKKRWKEGLSKKILAEVLAEFTLAAGWTQVFALSSASGYCPAVPGTSPMDAPQPPQLVLQPWAPATAGLRPGRSCKQSLTWISAVQEQSGTTCARFCWAHLPPSECSNAGEHPQHFLAGKGCEKPDLLLHSIYFSSSGGLHWRTWHKDWCLAYGIKHNLLI